MGTIADKLLYLDDTKTRLRTAINLRGGSVSGADTFRSYVEQLQQLIWLPDALFANDEQGVWYDPSAQQKVLDAFVRGSELVTNGTFDTDVSGWTGNAPVTLSFNAGAMQVTGDGTSYEALVYQSFATVVGKTYELSVEFISSSSGTRLVRVGSSAGGAEALNRTGNNIGVNKSFFKATQATTFVTFGTVQANNFVVDNVSVREITNYDQAVRDHAVLFQDSTGTTPVTAAGDPVGLMLDKSRGAVRGPELLENGDFANDTTGWSVGASAVVGGALAITDLFSNPVLQQKPTTSGVTYAVTFDVLSRQSTTATCRLRVGGGSYSGAFVPNPGTYHFLLVSAGGATAFELRNSAGAPAFHIDNISVKELPGNHATQSVSAARPTYQTDGTLHWIKPDGVDDFLVTGIINFTASTKLSVFVALRKLSDAQGVSTSFILGDSGITKNGFAMYAPHSTTDRKIAWSMGGNSQRFVSLDAFPAPATIVQSARFDNAASLVSDAIRPRVNGAAVGTTVVTAGQPGLGGFANDYIRIFKQDAGAIFSSNSFYGGIIATGETSDAEMDFADQYLASKSGVAI